MVVDESKTVEDSNTPQLDEATAKREIRKQISRCQLRYRIIFDDACRQLLLKYVSMVLTVVSLKTYKQFNPS